MRGDAFSRRGHPTDDHESRPAKRARSAFACQRCKQRKQRCDNGFPSCSNCVGAGEGHNCVYGTPSAQNKIYPPAYVASLEAQIRSLEQRVGVAVTPEGNLGQHLHVPPAAPNRRQAYSPPSQGNDLEAGTAFVALSPNAYLGDSSGSSLAKIVQSAIDRSAFLENRDDGDRTSSITQKSSGRHTLKDGQDCAKADMPSAAVASKLIEAYTNKVHSKHPFLSRAKLQHLNENRAELRPCTSSSNEEQLPPEDRLNYFTLHMVYAIGARYLQLSRDSDNVSPEAHYAAAIQDIDVVFNVQSLENLQCMLLLALYQLRSPSGPGLWSMIGVVMRHCLDSGLHRKSNLPALEDQRRKRLFWTVYMLERSVARTLGRPCCVTDREIDVELPANVSDDIEDEEQLIAAIDQASQHPYRITALSPAIHIIRIQRIESKIHRTVYRVDKPISSVQPHKISRLRAEIEDWRCHIQDVIPCAHEDETVPYNMSDYHMVQYYKATLLLLLPFLPSLAPTDPDFRLCAFAAGQICQLYKRLHDKQTYLSYSLLALHATFVAGLTMVYCFSMDPTIFDHKFSSDIRACSTVLYVVSERWPAIRKLKVAFERLVSATVEAGSVGGKGPCAVDVIHHSNPAVLQLNIEPATAGNVFRQGATPESLINSSSELGGGVSPANDVWDLFGTVLDEKDGSFRWTQEGFFNAMNAFPEYGWSL
ncbi:hypothetical protein VTK73DRAFT_9156 [Phialemonium thermophilum]|uniref:Zn(2)-C6 fungal-type domain-containing protein n=1 Tax=Phialemonium thermophilum TaxID=223376 RepID=A0ABR3XMD4_9PEZI